MECGFGGGGKRVGGGSGGKPGKYVLHADIDSVSMPQVKRFPGASWKGSALTACGVDIMAPCRPLGFRRTDPC